jgi:hypothetical protein
LLVDFIGSRCLRFSSVSLGHVFSFGGLFAPLEMGDEKSQAQGAVPLPELIVTHKLLSGHGGCKAQIFLDHSKPWSVFFTPLWKKGVRGDLLPLHRSMVAKHRRCAAKKNLPATQANPP